MASFLLLSWGNFWTLSLIDLVEPYVPSVFKPALAVIKALAGKKEELMKWREFVKMIINLIKDIKKEGINMRKLIIKLGELETEWRHEVQLRIMLAPPPNYYEPNIYSM